VLCLSINNHYLASAVPVFSNILDRRHVCCLLIQTDGASLTAANTLANTGASDPSRLNPPLASDRSFRKKPGSLLTRDSDSDSDSEEERARQRERERARANGGPGCSSNSASGATDGPSSSRIEAEIAGAGAAHGHNNIAFLKIDPAELDRDRNEQEERDDGFGQRKKKTKPSARKAANLSELRRYYKAAEEAAQEVLLEQGQLSVRNGPNSGFNSTAKQGAPLP
jgi:hypothetical protein